MFSSAVIFQPNGSYRFYSGKESDMTFEYPFKYIGCDKFNTMSRWYPLPEEDMKMVQHYCLNNDNNEIYGEPNPIGQQFSHGCTCIGLSDIHGSIAFFKYNKEGELVDFTQDDIDWIINYRKECPHKTPTKKKKKRKWKCW